MDSFLFKQTDITGGFWKKRQKLAVENIIPYQEKAIKDEIPGIAPSHAVANFEMAARKLAGEKLAENEGFYGMVFQDSDVAKWLEAASFSLAKFPDPELEKRIDSLIETIGKAQESDGYLDTYFTLKRPADRFKNLHDAHELYCAGHMIEAGVAHNAATGKTSLLDIVCHLADCIYKHFITDKNPGYSGHPEIELALMKLYRATENKKYLELAEHFINVRGVDADFFKKEMESRDWNVWGGESVDPAYHQAHKPVRQQTEAVGHAVRAGYLYTSMADLAFEKGDSSLFDASKTLWKNITQKRMYVTGGIGSTFHGEAFTNDFDLPNDTAYSETCAAISLMMFAKQMLRNEKLGEYGDVMECSLYNTVLAGMQLDGKRFFYVNPLEAITGISGISPTHKHALPERPGWYGCACCPPNVARTITDIADYAWLKQDDTLYSVLFMENEINLDDNGIKVSVKTEYPYDGKITYSVSRTAASSIKKLAVRIPSWARKAELSGTPEMKNGFAYYEIPANCTDFVITIDLKLVPRKLYCNNAVSSNTGKTALAYGPLIYCAEEVDNGKVLNLFAKRGAAPELMELSNELSGIRRLKIEGLKVKNSAEDPLYSESPAETETCEISLIPYYTWANRGLNQMRVWLPEM
ncbi:MAG: glycoside hydrolase family 127 protein [Treponema sp.]|nr:glycoside hydrolase family 127 protein [Treponema sp.]